MKHAAGSTDRADYRVLLQGAPGAWSRISRESVSVCADRRHASLGSHSRTRAPLQSRLRGNGCWRVSTRSGHRTSCCGRGEGGYWDDAKGLCGTAPRVFESFDTSHRPSRELWKLEL